MTEQTEQYLSIQESCKAVGVSRRTIYNWLKEGRLQFRRTAGGSVRILSSSLWRDENKKPVDTASAVAR